jgi:hypothetical protein
MVMDLRNVFVCVYEYKLQFLQSLAALTVKVAIYGFFREQLT